MNEIQKPFKLKRERERCEGETGDCRDINMGRKSGWNLKEGEWLYVLMCVCVCVNNNSLSKDFKFASSLPL